MDSKERKFQTLRSFCQDRSSFKTKFALLSFYKVEYSQLTEAIILVLEYLQLMSQIILSSNIDYDHPALNSFIFDIVVYFFKMINPSYLLDYGKSDATTTTVLTILFCFTLAKLALFLYVICVCLWDYAIHSWLLYIWKCLFKLQTRVVYFLLTSFWVKAIIESREGSFDLFGMSQAGLIVISSLVLAIEFLMSFVLEFQFDYVLPTKNLLSSKDSSLQVTTLFQKMIIQVLAVIFSSNSEACAWVCSVIGMLLSALREFQFGTKLPLYYFKALALQRALLCVINSLNLIYFLNTILKATSYEAANINFIILTWIVISLLAIKGAHECLKDRILRLLCTNMKSSPEISLHKVYATQELKALEVKPGKKNLKYHWTYLIATHQRTGVESVFGVDSGLKEEENSSEKSPEDAMSRVPLMYLEGLLARFPKHFLINLHTAYTCFKNAEPYAKTIKIANQIKQNKWSPNYLSASLLLYEIENSMFEGQKDGISDENDLNLNRYVQCRLLIENIKKKMLKQTELYLKVCGNILGDTANIEEIYSSGQKMSDLRIKIEKKINNASGVLPPHCISPLLCYAKYYSVVNHSSEYFEKYYQSYNHAYFKLEEKFKETNLLEENLYQDLNAFLLISTEKLDYGKILYCNSSLLSLCGGNNIKGYIGSRVTQIFSPSLRAYYDNFGKDVLKTDGVVSINKTYRTYLYHKEKYVIEVDFHAKYHPYLAQGLCINMIIRPVPMTAEFLLLKEDGNIEGASKELSKTLKLTDSSSANTNSSLISSRFLSRELYKINAAFNIVLNNQHMTGDSTTQQQYYSSSHKEKETNSLTLSSRGSSLSPVTGVKMSHERALELYNNFTAGFQKLQLYPYDKEAGGYVARSRNEAQTFYCHIEVVKFGSTTLKVVYLRPTTQESGGLEERAQDSVLELRQSKAFGEARWKTTTEEEGVMSTKRSLKNLNTKEKDDGGSENLNNEGEDEPSENLHEDEGQEDYAQQITIFDRPQTTNPNLVTDIPLLLSPTSETRRFLFNDGGSKSTRRTTIENRYFLSVHTTKKDRLNTELNTVLSFSNINLDEERKVEPNNNIRRPLKSKAFKYQGSQHSSKSGESASDKAFKATINTKSYPRSFIILCFIFYGVVLLTFIAQVIMKSVSDTTMENLQIKKNLMKLSQDRSYKAALIFLSGNGAILQLEGYLSAGGSIIDLSTTVDNLQLRMRDMKDANDEMLQNVYALEKEFQSLLFVKDVGINGTYLETADDYSGSYEEVNTFQATQEITNAIKTLDTLDNATSTAGYNIFSYLATNIVDDFQFKNVEITDIFISSVEKQKKSYQNIMNLCLFMTPFLLAGIGFLLMSIIWNQYRIEKKNMKAFIKISPSGVKDVSVQLSKFRKSLVDDESFERKWFTSMNEDFEAIPEIEQSSTYSKKHNTQILKYEEFRKRYIKYIFRVVIYMSILIAITIWDLVSTKTAIRVIYNRQGQLQFANYISNRVTTAYTAFNILFTTNNTMGVEHETALQAMYDATKQLQTIQTEIPSRFLEIDGTYNSQVKSIVFDNNPDCIGFTADIIIHCTFLLSKGQPVNMLVANTALLSSLNSKYASYLASTKTSMGQLLGLASKNVDIMLSNFMTIAYEAQTIADIMDESLTQKISDNRDTRNDIMIIFTIGLVLVSIIIWIDILRVIRNVYNDFKKVLQIVPPNLVLSSYLLKKFLRKTSNQLLLN